MMYLQISQGFKYAGTQWSKECFCGDEYQNYGEADNCDMPCSGDKTEICGGNWAMNIYGTGSVLIP